MKRVVLLVVVSAVACVPTAWGAGKTATTVTIEAVILGSGQTIWSGEVKSARKACRNRRTVLIFRVRSGPDVKVGSTRSTKALSGNRYNWGFSKVGAAPSGKYYAKVRPTETCAGDRSGSLKGPSFY